MICGPRVVVRFRCRAYRIVSGNVKVGRRRARISHRSARFAVGDWGLFPQGHSESGSTTERLDELPGQ